MKTSWSLQYLNRKMSGHEQAEWQKQKGAELQAKTGVPWSSHHAHGKIVFLPCLVWRDTVASDDHVARDRLIAAWVGEVQDKRASRHTSYVSFLRLAERSGLSLSVVMSVSKGLVLANRAAMTIDRMGAAVALKMK